MTVKYPIAQPKLEIQLSSIGFSTTAHTIPLQNVIANIKKEHGDAFITTHFLHKGPAECGDVLEALILHNLLRPKTIQDIFRSDEFETTINNIKLKNSSKSWDFAAIAKFHGKKVCEAVFKSGMRITYGDFPTAFPTIVPGHNQYPEYARDYNEKPMIQVQRRTDVPDAEFFDKLNFDPIYYANQNSRLFSTILKAKLNHAARIEGQQYTRVPPGCWWIDPVNLLNASKLPITTPLNADKIAQVLTLFKSLDTR